MSSACRSAGILSHMTHLRGYIIGNPLSFIIILMKYTIAAAIAAVAAAGDTSAWKQRSVYQLLTDRFAKDSAGGNACTDLTHYCGGTFAGLERELDYIQGMGFDAIWISPVIENGNLSNMDGYHGYWASNWDNINPHFGSADQLKSLVSAAHSRGIWVMVDVVANHVSPVGNDFG